MGWFDGSPCQRSIGQGLRFSTYRSLPSIRERANGVPMNRLFVRFAVSAVEAPKVTQISLSNLNDRSPVTQLQIKVSAGFPFELRIPSYSGRSVGVHFLRSFLYELPFRRYKALKSRTYPVFEISMTLRTRLSDTFHY